ncbi:Retrotransposable element Tf2 protein [Rhizoctonia solani]|uniref:RNA-directed DNA polymerase n=1 Tax=Rhizoctonia solani TaxID=456999 RepID=A0A8H8NUE9_9AGAM|nr:Retrotransposable element Tf2 protein [Rhizoctonia solani]QRW18621.1 Retrotransposable element Tf2 protein [Rhizoctonia solani]
MQQEVIDLGVTMEWPVPTKVKEVQLFLGFANFLRQFVANFSHMARLLHNLVKKNTPWQWNSKEQEAFQGLKDAITNALVLCHADPTKPYFLETNASGAALGSILSQCQDDGQLHPLGFLSELFKGAKQNYDTHNKELLAIIHSFEYWHIFLEGTNHPITVFTDHWNLEYWKESRTFNRCHAQWHLLLAGYNFQIVYHPGKQSGKPDALSRCADHANIPPADQTMLPDPVFANVALVTPKRELQHQIEASLDQDESLEEILQFLQNKSKAPPLIKRAFRDYEMEAGLLFYQGRIVVPDVGTLRTDLLRIFHNSPLAGHLGRQQTLELVSRNYYWPGIHADTYWHMDSCKTCQQIQKPKYTSIPPQPLELPTRPWQHMSYDMIVDLPKDGNSNSILVIVDSFTKYVILVERSKKLKAPELAGLFLRHIWKRYGMPKKTILDQGRVFNNKFLGALYQRLGIDLHFSSAYHPQSDGQTEQVNSTVEHFLQAYSGINQKDWVRWLPMAEFAYNNATHSSTGKSPFKALYGWELSLTLSNVPTDVPEADDMATQMEKQWQEIEAALQQSKSQMTAGETGEPISFKVGEEAWLDAKNTLSPKLTEQRLGPFKVTEKISNCAYRLKLLPSMRIHNVFYVGLLSKVKRDDKRAFENRPPPISINGEEEYKVEGIMDMEERNREWFFRVKWKGYGSEENTWEPRENLKNAEKMLKNFEKEMKKKALGTAKALKGGQCCTNPPYAVSDIPSTRSGIPHPYSRPTSCSSHCSVAANSQPPTCSPSPALQDLPRMEPEPSLGALLKAIQALTTQVGSLQDQVKSQGKQIIQLIAICKETNNLVGDKDQGGAQTKPGPLSGPVTPPTHSGGETHTPGMVRPGLKAPFCPSRGTGFDSKEEEEPRRAPKKEPQGTPKRSLGSLTPFDSRSSVKRPKMELPNPYKGDSRGQKATQWLDRMLLWMVVWILYHMTEKAANWALPLIGAIIKGKGNPPTTILALTAKFKEAFADPNAKQAASRKIAVLSQTTTTSKYVMEFCNLMAELDWNKEAYIAQFTQGLHWKVKELLSTKDNIPNKLKAIFAASIKIDNTCRKNKENRPKKAPAKSLATVATSTTTTRVRLSEDPNYVTLEERDCCCASGLCVKCGQKGHSIKQCPNGWKAAIKEVAKPLAQLDVHVLDCEFVSVALDSNKKPLLFIDLHLHNFPTEKIKTLVDSGATSNFISPTIVEKLKIPKTQLKNPQVVRMLDGTISQTGCIWHQVHLTVLANGHTHTIPFLVCPIGNTLTILGMTWLTTEAPLIDWQQGLITFPEQIQIASEEEAELDPLANLPHQYHEFAKVFGKEEYKVLPPHREYDISIDLIPDAKLMPGPIYSMTNAESKALKQHIDEELATGKIRPSTSSAGAPVMFVKKADGSLQLVVDYQKLNNVMHKNVYPLPRQDNLMAKLRHAKLFTKLDLRWGYNNIRIKEGDEWKTAFRTKYGLFEYLVMPFGLTNAPAAFQHFMNDLFRDLIDVTVVIYLDDILIFLEDPKDHPTHVREVLSRLMKNQLFCKLSKCHFHITTVDYLGIVISPAGFSMDQKKIEAVTLWPQPKTVKQVQAFLGFVNYLWRFIPNFSSVAHPLHNLTKKETPWSWGDLEEMAFHELKTLVTRSLVLIHSNPMLPYYLETDTSGVAMGAILSQQGPDNWLHPIAYMSKSFSGTEANYNTHNKELLAIIKALEEWRIFLEATDKPIQVFTDHWNLEYWMQAQTFNCRHTQWRIFLSNFNFEIHYRPGKQSGKPDALSRRSDYIDKPQEPEIMLPAEVFANMLEEELEIVTEIQSKLKEDPSLEPIIQFLTEDADNAPPSIQKAYQDYDWEEDLLWYCRKLVVPDLEPLKE